MHYLLSNDTHIVQPNNKIVLCNLNKKPALMGLVS